jgi:hypothetical protein
MMHSFQKSFSKQEAKTRTQISAYAFSGLLLIALLSGHSSFAQKAEVVSIANSKKSSVPERQHVLKLKGLLKASQTEQVLTLAELQGWQKSPLLEYRTGFKDEKESLFKGVLLKDLVTSYGLPSVTRVRVVAANQYEQIVSFQQPHTKNILLAFAQNGAPIPTRSRGTFRLVLPLDDVRGQQSEALYPLFVWSVVSLEFLP